MTNPSLNYHRLNYYDNLEWLDARNYTADFPAHFHDQICLSLVRHGIECTVWQEQQLYNLPGSFSLTPAGEVHANPNVNGESYSFVTFYLSPDVLRFLAGKRDIHFGKFVVQDPTLYQGFLNFTEACLAGQHDRVKLESLLRRLLQTQPPPAGRRHISTQALDVGTTLEFLRQHLDQKVTLEQLARQNGMSRFAFLRAFRKATGITPGQYLNIKRIEASRLLLKEGCPLVETALSVGYYDQSHFHRYFKKLMGITPRAYQRARNIIQE